MLSALVPRVLQAAPEDAAALFLKGEQAFEAGDYESAARHFQQAYSTSPHVSVLFNVAVSWDHASRPARAADAYTTALSTEGLTPEQAEEAERRLSALSRGLATLQVAKPIGGTVSVAHVEQESVPARFFLEPGSYEIEWQDARGNRGTTPVTVEAGETLKLVLEGSVAAPPSESTKPSPSTPPPETSPSRTQEILGWVGIGLAVAASGAAIYLGIEALNAKKRYENSNETDAAAYDDARGFRTATNVAWGSAGALGLLGGVVLFTSPTVEF